MPILGVSLQIAHFGHFCDFGGVFLGLTGSFTLTHGAIMHYEAKAAYKQAARAMRKANAITRKRSADRLGRESVSVATFHAPLTVREMARDDMLDYARSIDGSRYLHLGQVASELATVAKGTA